MQTRVTEIAPDLFQLTTFVADADLQFHQLLVRDDEPLLFHTGMRGLFPLVRDAVATVLPPGSIAWIGFSHFEADECGSLAEWQALAPRATAVCSAVAKMVSVDDVLAVRPARALADGETLATGRYRFRFLRTPHVPHCWEASLLFEETHGTLLCSDLFHQAGDVEPIAAGSVVDRCRDVLVGYQRGPFADYLPYTNRTQPTLARLAELRPRTIVPMHGSAWQGDGARAIGEYARMLHEVLG